MDYGGDMALGELAQLFAVEIKQHDWSDAPYRADKAGHSFDEDPKSPKQLEPDQAENVRLNVLWVVAQVLGYACDPDLDIEEFADACGHSGSGPTATPGWRQAGLRKSGGSWCRPGTFDGYGDTTDVTSDR